MLYCNDNLNKIIVSYKRNKNYIDYIHLVEKENGLPDNLLVSIFLVETRMRPFYFRCFEYGILSVQVCLNLLFKKPIKNFTIGKFQIGLSYILNYYGARLYNHIDYIPSISIREALKLLKSLNHSEHLKIVVSRILPLTKSAYHIYAKTPQNKIQNIFTYIGEQYNGQYAYGLLIAQIAEELKFEEIDIFSMLNLDQELSRTK